MGGIANFRPRMALVMLGAVLGLSVLATGLLLLNASGVGLMLGIEIIIVMSGILLADGPMVGKVVLRSVLLRRSSGRCNGHSGTHDILSQVLLLLEVFLRKCSAFSR